MILNNFVKVKIIYFELHSKRYFNNFSYAKEEKYILIIKNE